MAINGIRNGRRGQSDSAIRDASRRCLQGSRARTRGGRCGAVAGEMLIERDTVADAAEEISERRLAVFERLPPKIGAV